MFSHFEMHKSKKMVSKVPLPVKTTRQKIESRYSQVGHISSYMLHVGVL